MPDVNAANVVFANGVMLHRSGEEYPASAKVRLSDVICIVLSAVGVQSPDL